jgi:glycerate kinase
VGCGKQIRSAIEIGAKKVYVGLGGSATNDGGIGIAAAFGYTFYDDQGQPLKPIGINLSRISRIEKPQEVPSFAGVQIFAVNDVTNPLWGRKGAAYTYGPQKGANYQQVKKLDMGLIHLDNQVKKHLGIHSGQKPGSGAAGGAAFGLHAFLGASFISGSNFMIEYSGLKSAIREKKIDLIITGEGKIDQQTLQGKFIQGVLELGADYGVPVGAVCGMCTLSPKELKSNGFDWVLAISDPNQSLIWNLTNAAAQIEKKVEAFFSKSNSDSTEL